MNFSKTWALAFVNSLESEGVKLDEGFAAFKTLSNRIKSLPSVVYGRNAAEIIQTLYREGWKNETLPIAFELSIRFIVLMVRKNMFRHRDLIISDIQKLFDKKNGVVTARLEYAVTEGGEEPVEKLRITEAIKKRTGAAKLVLESKQNPALIGGYRVIIGDEVIDASISSQLNNMKENLQRGY